MGDLPESLSHDFGGRRGSFSRGDCEPCQPSGVYWSAKMREAAAAIMALPAPVRTEPVDAAGEIDRG